jgi:hypothetical protein
MKMNMTVRFVLLTWIAAVPPMVLAEVPVEIGQPTTIGIEPARVELSGRRSHQQLIVTGVYSEESLRDLTSVANFESSNTSVVKIEGAMAFPVGGQTVSIPVVVKNFEAPAPISFKNETQMALTKAGCNMGACHGSPSGKGGFRLSLRAYDPVLDIMTLRSEFYGRRTNLMEPSHSLLLQKPLMEVAHGGGKRLKKGEATYEVLENWIAEGMKLDPPAEPDLIKIETIPSRRILHQPAARQQLVVLGHFSDGSIRDLTRLTDFSSSSESVGSVNSAGLVTKNGRGETAVLARSKS